MKGTQGSPVRSVHSAQFVLGGQVLPSEDLWIKVSERLRGRALNCLRKVLNGDLDGALSSLPDREQQKLSLIAGKDEHGKPLRNHPHAYFLVWPDENGYPSRLIVWRRADFSEQEIAALYLAAERPITWQEKDSFTVYLVPLPLEMPLPRRFLAESQLWESLTRFVPPVHRHRFRRGCRLRRGESAEESARRLVLASGLPAPVSVSTVPDPQLTWKRLHETRASRRKQERGAPLRRPGYRLRLEFGQPVSGPILLGDSCHFGLGLFGASGSG